VAKKDLHRARLIAAEGDMAKTSLIGYEIFDRSHFGTSDYVQRLNYQRALEGELSRTIRSIQGVRDARVHLVLPKEELFSQRHQPASASVVIDLEESSSLERKTTRAIANLVASSVEGLPLSHVTILNTQGQLLVSGQRDEELQGLTDSQLELQKSVEKSLEDKIQSLLSEVLGEGKSVVRVNALLDFDKIDRVEKRFNPDSQVVKAENTYTKGESGAANAIAKRSVQFEVGSTVEHVMRSQGGLKQLTVAVVIDGTYQTARDDKGNLVSEYLPRSIHEIESFKRLISRTVGIDSARGDGLEVTNIPFQSSQMNLIGPEAHKEWKPVAMSDGFKIAAGIFLFFLLLLWAIRSGRPQAAIGGKETNEQKQKLSELENEVRDLAKKDPARAAKIISEWMSQAKEK
jgi:flagellar M-ring protein FliF